MVIGLGVVVLVSAVAFAVRERAATKGPEDASAALRVSGSTSGGAAASDGPDGAAIASGGSDAAAPRAEPKTKLVIHGTGDVSLDPSYIPNLRTYGFAYAWSGLHGLFRRDDLTVINLECPATDVSAPVPKEFNFRCDPAALPAARRHGVDVVSQSNNHAFDQGPKGLLDSVREIRRAGLAPVGAGADEEQALAPALFDLGGWKVAVLGIDEVLDPITEVAGPARPGTAAGHDFGLALRAVRRAAARADLVVVMIHWGVELDTQPREYQIAEAHRMIDAGADVIFGGHSHRLQPLAFYRGRPIFWSLGNFVWPHLSAEGSATGIAEVTVTRRGMFRARILPVSIASHGHPVLGVGASTGA